LEEKPINLNEALSGIPVQHRAVFQAAIRGWQNCIDFEVDRFVMELNASRTLETFSPSQLKSVDQILTNLLFNNRMRSLPELYSEDLLDIHSFLLDFAKQFLDACQMRNYVPSKFFVKVFLEDVKYFTITGNHRYFAHLNLIGSIYYFKVIDFVDSSLFSEFLEKECGVVKGSSDDNLVVKGFDLRQLAKDCIQDLTGFLHTRQTEFFKLKFRFTLALFKQIPGLSEEFAALPEIICWFRRLCDFGDQTFISRGRLPSDGVDGIKRLLISAGPDLPSSWGEALLDAFNRGEKHDEIAENSEPMLTVEWVYSELLKEIAGDGVLTSAEEEILRNMRNYLEISDESYRRIFNQAIQMPRHLDRDFDPCVFFRNIVKIAMADGILEPDEKKLLVKVSNALSVEKNIVLKIFEEVVNLPREENEFARSDSRSCIDDKLKDSWLNSMKLKIDLKSSEAGKHIANIAENLQEDKLYLLESSGSFDFPVIIHLTREKRRDLARNQYKGGSVNLRWSHDSASHMVVKNLSLNSESYASFASDIDEENIRSAIERALKKSNGRYGFALVSFPSATPVYFSTIEGGIDLSGEVSRFYSLLDQGTFPELDELDALVKTSKEIAESYRVRGLTMVYEAKERFKKGLGADKLLAVARTDFEFMIKKWPAMPEGYVGLAMVNRQECEFLGQAEKMAVAMKNLEIAEKLFPANVSTRITYAFYGSLLWIHDPEQLIEFERTQLSYLFCFQPDHHELIELLEQFKERFKIDFRDLASFGTVDTSLQ